MAESKSEGRLPTGPWIADWQALVAEGGGAPWVVASREAAIARFEELGFPTTRLEPWKYTNIAPAARGGYRVARAAEGSPSLFEAAWLDGVSGARVALLDGHAVKEASTTAGLPDRVRLLPFGAALAEHRELVEPVLGTIAAADEALIALNGAFLGDGVVLNVPAGVVVEEPIQIVHVSTAGAERAAHPRTLVVLGRGASARVVETWLTAGEGTSFVNAVTEVSLGDGAVLEMVTLGVQGPRAHHFHAVHARLGRAATLRGGVYAFGASIGRTEVAVALADEGATCELSGIALVDGRRHTDLRTFVDHAAPHGTSQQVFKGIASGAGRSVFSGRVLVRPGAQKTDARQSSQSLLLGKDAWADSRPQLEIFADDVKCAHGATVGQLDEDALFYLRARGIGAMAARAMLTGAFAGEVVDRAPVAALQPVLRAALAERLPVDGEEA